MTRIPGKIRRLVDERDFNRCVVCGEWTQGRTYSLHHRRPRGMGGTRKPDTPANLITVCGDGTVGCHEWIETNRSEASENGWLVSAYRDPADIPVIYPDGLPYYLDPDGSAHPEDMEGIA